MEKIEMEERERKMQLIWINLKQEGISRKKKKKEEEAEEKDEMGKELIKEPA